MLHGQEEEGKGGEGGGEGSARRLAERWTLDLFADACRRWLSLALLHVTACSARPCLRHVKSTTGNVVRVTLSPSATLHSFLDPGHKPTTCCVPLLHARKIVHVETSGPLVTAREGWSITVDFRQKAFPEEQYQEILCSIPHCSDDQSSADVSLGFCAAIQRRREMLCRVQGHSDSHRLFCCCSLLFSCVGLICKFVYSPIQIYASDMM